LLNLHISLKSKHAILLGISIPIHAIKKKQEQQMIFTKNTYFTIRMMEYKEVYNSFNYFSIA